MLFVICTEEWTAQLKVVQPVQTHSYILQLWGLAKELWSFLVSEETRKMCFIVKFYNINYRFQRTVRQKVLPPSELLPFVKLSPFFFLGKKKITIFLLYRIFKKARKWNPGDWETWTLKDSVMNCFMVVNHFIMLPFLNKSFPVCTLQVISSPSLIQYPEG